MKIYIKYKIDFHNYLQKIANADMEAHIFVFFSCCAHAVKYREHIATTASRADERNTSESQSAA